MLTMYYRGILDFVLTFSILSVCTSCCGWVHANTLASTEGSHETSVSFFQPFPDGPELLRLWGNEPFCGKKERQFDWAFRVPVSTFALISEIKVSNQQDVWISILNDFQQGVTSCLIPALLSLTVGTGSGCRKLTWFIIGQLAHSRPADLGGHTQYLQGHVTVQFIAVTSFFYKIVSHSLPHLPDGLQLFKLCCVSWERHRPLQHLYENTPSSPETNKDSQPLKSCMS